MIKRTWISYQIVAYVPGKEITNVEKSNIARRIKEHIVMSFSLEEMKEKI